MAWVTIDGTEVYVNAEGVVREEPLVIGEEVPAFDGTLLSTVRGIKHRWTIPTHALTTAEAAVVEAACGDVGALVDVAGDCFPEMTTPFLARCRVIKREPLQDCDQATGARWDLAIRIQEA